MEKNYRLSNNMKPKQDDSSDVTLVLKDGKEIRASRNELSGSDFFSSLLNSDMRENREGIIRLEHITETVMRDVLEFMFCGSVKITSKNAVELIKVADYLLLPKLKVTTERFLRQELSTLNCFSIYYFAEKYQCKELIVNSRDFIFSNFATVADFKEFLNLESQQVEQWICRNEIAVNTESDVFRFVVQWIQQSKSDRKGKFEELFRHVRLSFISRDYLRMHVLSSDLVRENRGCLKLVKDAIKGIYCTNQHSPRKWRERHMVVLRGMETYCYQLDEDKWYQLAHAPLQYNLTLNEDQQYQMAPLQGRMYVFPSSIHEHPFCDIDAHGEIFYPSLNRWFVLHRQGCRQQGTDLRLMDKRRTVLTAMAVVGSQMYSIDAVIDIYTHSRFCSISKYNVGSNSWDVVIPKIEFIRGGACAVAMENYLYVLGGYNHSGQHTTYAARLDITENEFERIADMNIERSHACGIAAHGKVFVAGGIWNKTCEMYNLLTNEWQPIASFNAFRSKASMLCFEGTLYVLGGEHGGGYSSSDCPALTVESYDFLNKRWNIRTHIPAGDICPKRKAYLSDFIKACLLYVPNDVLGKPIGSRKGLKESFKHVFQRR